MKIKKICACCKKEFITKDERRVTCSSRCSKEYNNPQKPEVKARQRAYKRAYMQKPEVKARQRAYQRAYYQKPEVKARQRAYRQKPEVKARQRAYRQKPEVKARKRAYYQKPEVKARKRAYYQKPEVKARQRAKLQRKGFVKIPTIDGKKRVVYVDGFAEELQKKIPKLTEKIMMKMVKGGKNGKKYIIKS